jgi:hypothetical protein
MPGLTVGPAVIGTVAVGSSVVGTVVAAAVIAAVVIIVIDGRRDSDTEMEVDGACLGRCC